MQKIVLKIGGSIITERESENFPLAIEEIRLRADAYVRFDEIRRIGRELKEALDEIPTRLVLINGVGPFGHFLAKHNRPADEVQESDRLLSEKLVSELRKIGLDIVPIPPPESCEFAGGKFDIDYLWEIAEMLLEEGKIPSTYGDMLGSGKIISGDDLAELIAERWHADRIIVATDVDGIFTKNPADCKDARLLKRIAAGDTKADAKVEYTISKIDVTGGMQSKVEKMKRAAAAGIECRIINGMKPGNIKAALLGDESFGTSIVA
jgi:isopentenyl phosphate kinase